MNATQQPRRLAEVVRELSFHPDDVPELSAYDVLDLLIELLHEYGWKQTNSSTLTWGDSGSPVTFEIWVGGFGSIQIDEFDAGKDRTMSTQFTGTDWRTITPRALAYLATLQS